MDRPGQGGAEGRACPITDAQIAELEAHADDINYDVAEAREKEVRHDVMSHVYAYGVQCPTAKGIIHLGATSCYVGDNTDVIVMREGLRILRRKLLNVVSLLADFADRYKDMPALAYTHLQPAQLTTVGKRATLWLNELMLDYGELEHRIASLKLLGSKGTTGTQASFVELFDGDSAKIRAVEEDIAREMGFDAVVPVSGQTYSRKVDSMVVGVLAGIAQSASKFSNDLRILAELQGDGGAVRGPPDRLVGDALQAQPDAQRADHRARALCDDRLPQPGVHRRDPVVRAHPRRQRQQAGRRGGGVPRHRRDSGDHAQRLRRAGRLSQGGRASG